MTLRSSSVEVPAIIHQLGSRSRTRVDAARARLALIGSRAVDALIEALEEDNNRIKSHVMPVMALIQDPRTREPLIAMLLDRNVRLRKIAVRSLARFPSAETSAALNRVLRREANTGVRVAAVEALVELYAAGEEQAVGPVVERLLDGSEESSVRLAAFALLPALKSAVRRSLLNKLKQDDQGEIRERAELVASGGARELDAETIDIRKLLDDLASEDYSCWNSAVHRIGARGADAVHPLIAEMQRRAHDPEYCTRAGMALKALGRRRCRAIGEALDEVQEPLPLQVMVDVIGSLGEKHLIYRLKELIQRIAEPVEGRHVNGFDPLQRVRARAHLELARVGSRVAIGDLRGLVETRGSRTEAELFTAMELIGTRDEVAVLLRRWIEEPADVREQVATAVRAIMRRERLRRNARVFQSLSAEERRALDAILPPAVSARARRGTAAKPSPTPA